MPAISGCLDWRKPIHRRCTVSIDPLLAERGQVSKYGDETVSVIVFGSTISAADVARRYRAEKLELLHSLNGDFAIIIDDIGRNEFHLVRNHAGTRPLYFAQLTEVLLFASDIRSIAQHPDIEVTLDETALASYLVGAPLPAGHTLAEQIKSVAPAHIATFSAASTVHTRYWHPETLKECSFATMEAAAKALRELLAEVITEATPKRDHMGVHLTGGLDSTVVALHATHSRSALQLPLPQGYAWQAAPSAVEHTIDQNLIALVAGSLALKLKWLPLDVDSFLQNLQLNPMITPFTSTADHEIVVMKAARDDGVSLIMSGWGGDEFVSYNGRHRRPTAVGRAKAVIKGLAMDLFLGVKGRRPTHAMGRGYKSVQFNEQYPAPPPLNFNPPCTARDAQLKLLQYGHLAERADSWSVLGAEHGLQYSFPLLDRRALEFAICLPERFHLKGRQLMREALRGVAPDPIVNNTDKSDPARSGQLRTMLDVELRNRRSDITIDPDCSRYINLEKIIENLTGNGPIQQPGKLIAALRFACAADGIPLITGPSAR